MECRTDEKHCCFCIENNDEHSRDDARVSNHCTAFSNNVESDPEEGVARNSALRKECNNCEEYETFEYKDSNSKLVCAQVHCDFSNDERDYPNDIGLVCFEMTKLSSKKSEVPSKKAEIPDGSSAKLKIPNGYVYHEYCKQDGLSKVSNLNYSDSEADIISGNKYYRECFEGNNSCNEQMQSLLRAEDKICSPHSASPTSTGRHITRAMQSNIESSPIIAKHAEFENHDKYDEEEHRLKNTLENSCATISDDLFPVTVINENSALMACDEISGSGETSRLVEDFLDQPSMHKVSHQRHHITQCRDLEEGKAKAEVGRFQRDSSQTEVKQVLSSDNDRTGNLTSNQNSERLHRDAEMICTGPEERIHEVKTLLMCPPMSTSCPAGLETLLDASQLVVHMGNLRHDIFFNIRCEKRMEVIDETRRMKYYVEQEPMLLSNRNSFLFKLYDRSKQEVMQIYNPASRTCLACGIDWHWFKTCHLQAVVYSPLGVISGFIKRAQTCLVQEFHILAPNEALLLRLRGSATDLEIYSVDLQHGLGRLTVHGWVGVMHEVRRTSHDYGLTFPLDMDVRVKSLLLASVFVIDWLYSSDARQRR